MGKEIITFDVTEVEKKTNGEVLHHQRRSLVSIYDVHINKIVVFNKVPFGKIGFKYFTGYEDDSEKNIPYCIMLPNTSAYRRNFDETKYIF